MKDYEIKISDLEYENKKLKEKVKALEDELNFIKKTKDINCKVYINEEFRRYIKQRRKNERIKSINVC